MVDFADFTPAACEAKPMERGCLVRDFGLAIHRASETHNPARRQSPADEVRLALAQLRSPVAALPEKPSFGGLSPLRVMDPVAIVQPPVRMGPEQVAKTLDEVGGPAFAP